MLQVNLSIAPANSACFLIHHVSDVIDYLLRAVFAYSVEYAVLAFIYGADWLALRLKHASDLEHGLAHAAPLLSFYCFSLWLCVLGTVWWWLGAKVEIRISVFVFLTFSFLDFALLYSD